MLNFPLFSIRRLPHSILSIFQVWTRNRLMSKHPSFSSFYLFSSPGAGMQRSMRSEIILRPRRRQSPSLSPRSAQQLHLVRVALGPGNVQGHSCFQKCFGLWKPVITGFTLREPCVPKIQGRTCCELTRCVCGCCGCVVV